MKVNKYDVSVRYRSDRVYLEIKDIEYSGSYAIFLSPRESVRLAMMLVWTAIKVIIGHDNDS